jgi:hypothetical protein
VPGVNLGFWICGEIGVYFWKLQLEKHRLGGHGNLLSIVGFDEQELDHESKEKETDYPS